MKNLLNFDYLLDFIFPRHNNEKTTNHSYLSKNSFDNKKSKLKVLDDKQRRVLDGIFIASKYDDEIAQLFDRVKFGLEYKILDDLSDLLYEKVWVESQYFVPDPDFIVPIPDDEKRFLQRGFSVSRLLADNLSKKIDKPVVDILRKKSRTKKQAVLSREDRIKNLHGAFELVNWEELQFGDKEVVWLIDDISTTGTTIYECGKLIKKKFPFLKIYGVVVSGG